MIQTRCYERPHGRPSSAWTRWRRRPELRPEKGLHHGAPPEQRPGSTGKLSGQPQIYPGRVKDAFVIRMTEHNHKRTLFEFTLVRRLALLGPFGRAVVKNLPLHALHVLLPAPNTQA